LEADATTEDQTQNKKGPESEEEQGATSQIETQPDNQDEDDQIDGEAKKEEEGEFSLMEELSVDYSQEKDFNIVKEYDKVINQGRLPPLDRKKFVDTIESLKKEGVDLTFLLKPQAQNPANVTNTKAPTIHQLWVENPVYRDPNQQISKLVQAFLDDNAKFIAELQRIQHERFVKGPNEKISTREIEIINRLRLRLFSVIEALPPKSLISKKAVQIAMTAVQANDVVFMGTLPNPLQAKGQSLANPINITSTPTPSSSNPATSASANLVAGNLGPHNPASPAAFGVPKPINIPIPSPGQKPPVKKPGTPPASMTPNKKLNSVGGNPSSPSTNPMLSSSAQKPYPLSQFPPQQQQQSYPQYENPQYQSQPPQSYPQQQQQQQYQQPQSQYVNNPSYHSTPSSSPPPSTGIDGKPDNKPIGMETDNDSKNEDDELRAVLDSVLNNTS